MWRSAFEIRLIRVQGIENFSSCKAFLNNNQIVTLYPSNSGKSFVVKSNGIYKILVDALSINYSVSFSSCLFEDDGMLWLPLFSNMEDFIKVIPEEVPAPKILVLVQHKKIEDVCDSDESLNDHKFMPEIKFNLYEYSIFSHSADLSESSFEENQQNKEHSITSKSVTIEEGCNPCPIIEETAAITEGNAVITEKASGITGENVVLTEENETITEEAFKVNALIIENNPGLLEKDKLSILDENKIQENAEINPSNPKESTSQNEINNAIHKETNSLNQEMSALIDKEGSDLQDEIIFIGHIESTFVSDRINNESKTNWNNEIKIQESTNSKDLNTQIQDTSKLDCYKNQYTKEGSDKNPSEILTTDNNLLDLIINYQENSKKEKEIRNNAIYDLEIKNKKLLSCHTEINQLKARLKEVKMENNDLKLLNISCIADQFANLLSEISYNKGIYENLEKKDIYSTKVTLATEESAVDISKIQKILSSECLKLKIKPLKKSIEEVYQFKNSKVNLSLNNGKLMCRADNYYNQFKDFIGTNTDRKYEPIKSMKKNNSRASSKELGTPNGFFKENCRKHEGPLRTLSQTNKKTQKIKNHSHFK